MRRVIAIAVPALLLVACEPPPMDRTPLDSYDLRPTSVDLEYESATIVNDVVAFRGLSLSKPVPVHVLDPPNFDAVFRALSSKNGVGKGAAAPPLVSPDLYEGFFSPKHRRIFVRQLPKEGVDPRRVLAHEVEHALQFEHFAEATRPATEDQELARAALREGEAELVSIGYVEKRAGRPWRLAMRAASTLATRARVATMVSRDEALAPDAREQLLFKYLSGLSLASALYRAGGFDLLNRALEHPPETTEQVLYPERYARGETTAVIDGLPVPSGFERDTDTYVGAYSRRLALSKCASEAAADGMIAGWAGGRTATFRKGEERAWADVSVWDSEDVAARVERALDGCSFPSTKSDRAHRALRRDGNVVTYVNGVPSPAEYAAQLPKLVSPPPPRRPPFGKVFAIPPAPPRVLDRPDHGGEVRDGAYENAWLGVAATLPEGFGIDAEPRDAVYLSIAAPGRAYGSFVVFERRTGEERDRMHEETLRAHLAASGGSAETVSGWTTRTKLGDGNERRWEISKGDKTWFLDSVIVTGCDGEITYQWVRIWGHALSRQGLDDWLTSFRSTGYSEACADLRDELEDDER